MRRVVILLYFLLIGLVPATSAAILAPTDPVTEQIRQWFDSDKVPVRAEPAVVQAMERFYSDRDYRPAWLQGQVMTPLAGSFYDVLRRLEKDGLRQSDYQVDRIRQLVAEYHAMWNGAWKPENQRLATLELELTRSFLEYASHQITGRLSPADLSYGWHSTRRTFDPVQLLHHAMKPGTFGQAIYRLPPPHPGYLRLKNALETYRDLAQIPDWPMIPDGDTLKPGDWNERLPQIRRLLRLTGDLTLLTEEPTYYDKTTEEAVRRFQRRHGLTGDGIVGPNTLSQMNVPPSARVDQIIVNMERWRWLPKDLGKRHVMVNIAAFELDVVEDDENVMSMAVVVGKGFRKTPVFSDRIRYLEFAPSWNIPPTILKEDILPVIRPNPEDWFARHPDFEIVPWKRNSPDDRIDPMSLEWERLNEKNFPGLIRQRPGPQNPLGQVKFMFPNSFSIYLHDTPTRHLFMREKRTFSSGCIRVEKPLELAEYLLEPQVDDWPLDRILENMEAEDTSQVILKRPVPVHLLYWTAWVNPDGQVQFRSDVYERDRALRQALDRSNSETRLAVQRN